MPSAVTVTCEVVDIYGFVIEEVQVSTPREAGMEGALAEARAQFEANIRNGYEAGSYKADAVIGSVANVQIKAAA